MAARRSETTDDLHLVEIVEQGKRFATAEPVTFRFVRNTERSPHFGSTYGQDIEPAGRYMVHNEDPGDLARGWETGLVTFQSPLVILLHPRHGASDLGSVYDQAGWKARLSRAFGNTKGKALSRALRESGYDGIVTVGSVRGQPFDTREIVDLTMFGEGRKANPARTLGDLGKADTIRLFEDDTHLEVEITKHGRVVAYVRALRMPRGYDVLEVEADHGWGPLAYDLLMERATELGEALGAGDPSWEARALWQHYGQRRDVWARYAPSELIAERRTQTEPREPGEPPWFPEGDMVFQKEPVLLRKIAHHPGVRYEGDWAPAGRSRNPASTTSQSLGPREPVFARAAPRGVREIGMPTAEEAVRRAADLLGVQVTGPVYGCGDMGCVAPAGRGLVIKVTSDPYEAALVEAAADDNVFDGFARVYIRPVEVWSGPSHNVHAYVREDIAPYRFEGGTPEAVFKMKRAADFRDEEAYERALPDAAWVLPGVVRFAERLYRKGLILGDMHGNNIGQRPDGSLVMFDGRVYERRDPEERRSQREGARGATPRQGA